MNEVDMELLTQEWAKAKQYTEKFTSDFKDLDAITDGAPITHEKGAPYVGDTTLAGLKRAIPRASLRQIPVFSAIVNGSKNNIQAVFSSFILRKGVFNQDTFGKGLLSTMQMGGEQAISHGYAPFMVATGSMYDQFGTTMKLLHYSNVAPETGIQDANEGAFFYVEADVTKSRVKRILRAAKENENTTWNVEALEKLLEMEPEGGEYTKYLPSTEASIGSEIAKGTYKFVTRYETGPGGNFITFCPQMQDTALRTMPNRSKFGYPRVQFLVIDPAALHPFGTSRTRLASPNQNLMNAYYQNIASMFILNSRPPLLIRGRFANPVHLKQGARWEALDTNASVELKEVSNGALQQFVPMAQQMAAQIQNIMGAPQGNTNGNNNAMGYSKTAPGVKMQSDAMSMNTNQVTNIMENFLRQYALVALDTYICEQMGDDTIVLDDEAKTAMNRIQPGMIGDDNKMEINWEQFYEGIESWSVEIELSIGKEEMDEKLRGDLQDTLTTILQNGEMLTPELQAKASQIMDMLLEKSVPGLVGVATPTAPALALPTGGVENVPQQ